MVASGDDARSRPLAPGDAAMPWEIPRVPASAGALVFDGEGRLLILHPTYKPGWTIPGGQMEADGESPWDACRREVLEETGLTVEHGRLVCVDFLRPRPRKPGGMRFLFDCGVLPDEQLAGITLQAEELDDHRLVDLVVAEGLLSGPLRRRVRAVKAASGCIYLEDGRPVAGVTTA